MPPAEPDSPRTTSLWHGLPVPLAVAAGLTFLEGLVTVVLGVVEVFSVNHGRVVMGATTALFFTAYGVGLVVSAWGISRLRPWSRGPVLFAQLAWLGIAWSYRNGSTTVPAVGLAVVAVIVLGGLLHPASVRALDRPTGE